MKINPFVLILISVLIFASCWGGKKSKTQEIKLFYENGKPFIVGKTYKGEIEGEWTEYFPDGKISITFSNDVQVEGYGFHRYLQEYYEDGTIKQTCTEKIVDEGEEYLYHYSWFYPNGLLSLERYYTVRRDVEEDVGVIEWLNITSNYYRKNGVILKTEIESDYEIRELIYYDESGNPLINAKINRNESKVEYHNN